ncbi:hypothetical protein [Rhodococcus sp. 14-2470-1a]|uniref:hypothetical protein n=1 Tax=Rhodococcus sp. 14-2470-1a TaxID=2023150 RepID=UPI000B9B1A88|nr:hypothetical protein [Rhodococcus sp. 14-2470-1a]OZF42081.1 hypothetical protein CH292_26675 [Rhodococcus sp. 14-2470-1a]
MSAFTVPNEHIDVLVHAGRSATLGILTWAVPYVAGELPLDSTISNGIIVNSVSGSRARQLTGASVDAVGQMLVEQNVASVNDTYDEDDLAIYTHRQPRNMHRSPVEILKAISAYRYQSDGTADWASSEAFNFCEALETVTIQKMRGWEDAAWVIGRETPTLAEQHTRTGTN